MSSFSSLKTAIANAIKANGNQEITGNLLQGILLSIVETLGDSAINTLETDLSNEATTRGNADTELNNLITDVKSNVDNGYVYAGIAIPSTTPVSGKVFYIALQAGTYTSFGNTAVTQGINILKYNGSVWSKDIVIGIDDVPTAGSGNLVKSGGAEKYTKRVFVFQTLPSYNVNGNTITFTWPTTASNNKFYGFVKGLTTEDYFGGENVGSNTYVVNRKQILVLDLTTYKVSVQEFTDPLVNKEVLWIHVINNNPLSRPFGILADELLKTYTADNSIGIEKIKTADIDSNPTIDSNLFVKSGGVAKNLNRVIILQTLPTEYDITNNVLTITTWPTTAQNNRAYGFARRINGTDSYIYGAESGTNSYTVNRTEMLVFDLTSGNISVVQNGGDLTNKEILWFCLKDNKGYGILAEQLEERKISERIARLESLTYTSVNKNIIFQSREGRVDGAPGNSLAGCYNSYKKGYTSMRASLRVTSDGYFVLSHDNAINDEARNTDGTAISTTINISEHTLEELNAYDFGIKYGVAYAGLKICELEPMIKQCALLGLQFTIELKVNLQQSQVANICKLVTKYGMLNNTWVNSVNLNGELNLFKEECPRFNIELVRELTTASTLINAMSALKTNYNKVRLHLFYPTLPLDNDFIYEIEKNGFDMILGTQFTEQDLIAAVENGAAYIETDLNESPYQVLLDYAQTLI